VDLAALGERTLTVDCDVLNADGGTRCAAITGAWVATALALRGRGLEGALVRQVAAVSAGIVESGEGRQGQVVDLEYEEDHLAAVDANLVAARSLAGGEMALVEFQGTGEGRPFGRSEAGALVDLGLAACERLMAAQRGVLG
jgi:ribonuclease PH